MAKIGRPLKLTPELTENVATALSNGFTRETAARMSKISYQSLFEWHRRGRAEKEKRESGEKPDKKEAPYLNFFNQIEEAETDAIAEWQNTINKAARLDPTWAFKMLSLRDPKGYMQTPINYTAEIDMSKLTDEQLERIANGENPADVIANPSNGTAAAETAKKPAEPARE